MMKKILTSICFLASVLPLCAQSFTGRVFYRKPAGAAEPLPFAQIYFLEKSRLIDADAEGCFKISNYGTKATLIATYVGYSRDTVVVTPDIAEADFFLTGENDAGEAVVTAKQDGLSRIKPIKTEVISAAGLCKMACCAVAESFENSASVTVGYADAVTGARQIKLLGLSGTYTQLLDENRPVMRGLSNPFGLSYIPGQWLESIQISKGPSSVVNGVEAITGQINMEHRKPTDETPLFVQLYGSSDAMLEANVVSALQFSPKWSTIFLTHVGSTPMPMDSNGDGFRDEPENLQINLANRWLYYAPGGLQLRFGWRFINDDRLGGQMTAGKDNDLNLKNNIWGSNILNRGINGYAKLGVPVGPDGDDSVAAVVDFNHHEFNSFFGLKNFDAGQNSLFLNLLYRNVIDDVNTFEAGLTGKYDKFDQMFVDNCFLKTLSTLDLGYSEYSVGAFGEYTCSIDDKMTFVSDVSLEYNNNHGWLFTPRANFKYSFTDDIVFRLLGGRGYRCSNIITDNLGMLSTGYAVRFADGLNDMEDAWTFGGNVTFYLPFGFEEGNTYLSFDYFRNTFGNQVIVDQDHIPCVTDIYNLDGQSFTNTYQVDFNVDPFERFNVVATFRYTDAKVSLAGQGLVERPLSSRFKGVLNMQYSAPMNKWIFDVTAQINGPMRLPHFAAQAWGMEESPVYPMFYAQITRRFKGIDVYAGAENIAGFRQQDAIILAGSPLANGFNASCVWGPLMGSRYYLGLRYTLWK